MQDFHLELRYMPYMIRSIKSFRLLVIFLVVLFFKVIEPTRLPCCSCFGILHWDGLNWWPIIFLSTKFSKILGNHPYFFYIPYLDSIPLINNILIIFSPQRFSRCKINRIACSTSIKILSSDFFFNFNFIV